MSHPILLILFISLPWFSPPPHRDPLAGYQNKGVNRGRIVHAKTKVRQTGIWFPRLVSYSDQTILRKVNRQIDRVTAEFGCESGGRHSYYKVRSRVDLAEKEIFSIYASAEYYCGGPYPTNDSNISLTFDLRTGKLIQFEELFADYQANKREILRTIFARQVERSERLAEAGKQADDTCEGNPDLYSLDSLEGSEFSFNLSRVGLNVQPQWPHVVEACAEVVTVPYHQLRRFAAPNGLLERMTR